MAEQRLLRIFLCHASEDKPLVRELYQRMLVEAWIEPWLDENKLLPGQDWRTKIEEAVEESDVVIVCLSNNSANKDGFVQKELRYAREIALEKSEDSIFLVPLRLEDCDTPRGLRFFQWADYFGEKKDVSYQDLLKSLKVRLEQLSVREAREKDVREKMQREQTEREVSEKAALEKAEKITHENTMQEKAKEYDAAEKSAHENEEIARKEAENVRRKETEEQLLQEKEFLLRRENDERINNTSTPTRSIVKTKVAKKNSWRGVALITLFSGLAILLITFCGIGIYSIYFNTPTYFIPTLTNVHTAKDENGDQPSSVFAATDTVYVVGDLSNGVTGNVVSSKWYAVEVADTEPNLLLDEADISIDEDKSYTLYFYFPPPLDGQWPVGSYKVEIYFNGVLNSTVPFTVQ